MAGARRESRRPERRRGLRGGRVLTTPAALATYHGDPWVILNPADLGVKVTGTAQYQTAGMQQAAGVLKSLH